MQHQQPSYTIQQHERDIFVCMQDMEDMEVTDRSQAACGTLHCATRGKHAPNQTPDSSHGTRCATCQEAVAQAPVAEGTGSASSPPTTPKRGEGKGATGPLPCAKLHNLYLLYPIIPYIYILYPEKLMAKTPNHRMHSLRSPWISSVPLRRPMS